MDHEPHEHDPWQISIESEFLGVDLSVCIVENSTGGQNAS